MTSELWKRALRLVRVGADTFDGVPERASNIMAGTNTAKELYEAAAIYRTGKQQQLLKGWVTPYTKINARAEVTEAAMRVQKDIDTWRTRPPTE